MRNAISLVGLICCLGLADAFGQSVEIFEKGEGISLEKAIPANERGILCLAMSPTGRIYGGTTGRAAHLFVCDPVMGEVRSLARLDGGIGFSYVLIHCDDGSLIAGTQADPTGIARKTDPEAVGHLYRFIVGAKGEAKVEDLGVPIQGQGIYTLAYSAQSKQIVGNTWPDGHFFSFDMETRTFKDHGAIAGYHTFETPRHADDLNRGTDEKIRYPRHVSRTIAIDCNGQAYTGGTDGYLYRYDFQSQRLEKLSFRLPAIPGRESWNGLDAAVIDRRTHGADDDYCSLVGGTSDGYLFELRIFDRKHLELRPRGKPFPFGTIQAMVNPAPTITRNEEKSGKRGLTMLGIAGSAEGMPRGFSFSNGSSTSAVRPGGIPQVDGQRSMKGIGAMVADDQGNLYAGERDRIARLIRFPVQYGKSLKKPTNAKTTLASLGQADPSTPPAKLDCRIVLAPQGTTTDGSGYTAIEVAKDGLVYCGAARYGGYAWLLRFDPTKKPLFMDKVVNLQQLTGERLKGINTQGKIHSKILVGADGRVWFASKQAHEVFDTRPEYDDPDGFPGGHLCYFDPKTGFSRSMGILKRHEGLVAGAIDDARGKLYYRSEPKNHFLIYDLQTGEVADRGPIGAACRYMAVDKNGAVFTVGRGNYLVRYDPETGYIEDLAIKIAGDGGYTPPYVIALGPNGKLYGAAAGHPFLMEFAIDSFKRGAFPEVVMRNAAPAAPSGMPVQDIHAAVFGNDGKLYYPLNTTGPLEMRGNAQAHLRIMCFDPVTKNVATIGVPNVIEFDEEKVKHVYARKEKYKLQYMQGAAIGKEGSLYLLAIYPQLHVVCFP